MSTTECFTKENLQMKEKFNFGFKGTFSKRKLLRVLKVVKPVVKLMKKQRTNAVTPSACNYDVVESFQNDLNECELFQLKFNFFDSDEADENLRNEELERRLLEKLGSEQKPEHACPSHCLWTPSSDVDICQRGDDYLTCRQTAERQIPVPVM